MHREIALNQKYQYREEAHQLSVSAQPLYLSEQSQPSNHLYLWAFKIKLENNSDMKIQLLRRKYIITDSNGASYHVCDTAQLGVVPTVNAGEIYEYSSFTQLPTASGFMFGSFEVLKEDNERLTISIPPFSLDSPEEKRLPN